MIKVSGQNLQQKNELSASASMKQKLKLLEDLNEQLHAIRKLEYRMSFSPMFRGYKLRRYWGVIDAFALYFHVLKYFVVLLLILFWWFNGSLILQFFAFALLNVRIGGKIFDQKEVQKRKASSRREERKQATVTDREIVESKALFDEKIKHGIRKSRESAWSFHFIILALTLIIIYPSQYLLTFQNEAISKGKEEGLAADEHTPVEALCRTLIYFMFLGGVFHDSQQDGGEPTGPTPSFLKQVYGYLLILLLSLIERICLNWLLNRFGCTPDCETAFEVMDLRITQICDRITALELKIREEQAVIDAKHSKGTILEEEEEKSDDLLMDASDFAEREDAELDRSQSGSIDGHAEEKKIEALKAEIKKHLEVHVWVDIMKGVRVILEDLIVLLIWSSALFKMNLQSWIFFGLIIFYMLRRRSGTIRFCMNTVLVIMLIRLCVTLSNMNEEVNPMVYPVQYQSQHWDMYGQWQFAVPWVEYLPDYRDAAKRQYFVTWAYWATIFMFNQKLDGLVIDFVTVALIYVYYQTCQFWVYSSSVEVVLSGETRRQLRRLKELVNHEGESPLTNRLTVNESEWQQRTDSIEQPELDSQAMNVTI